MISGRLAVVAVLALGVATSVDAGQGDTYHCQVLDYRVFGTGSDDTARVASNLKKTFEVHQLEDSFRLISVSNGQFMTSDDYILVFDGSDASYSVSIPSSYIGTFVIDRSRDASGVSNFKASITKHDTGAIQSWFLSCSR